MLRPFTVVSDQTLLGVNFWSRVGGPRMWTRYEPAVVSKELQVLAYHEQRKAHAQETAS